MLNSERQNLFEWRSQIRSDQIYVVNQVPTQANFATLIGSSGDCVESSRLKNDSVINISARGLKFWIKNNWKNRHLVDFIKALFGNNEMAGQQFQYIIVCYCI